MHVELHRRGGGLLVRSCIPGDTPPEIIRSRDRFFVYRERKSRFGDTLNGPQLYYEEAEVRVIDTCIGDEE